MIIESVDLCCVHRVCFVSLLLRCCCDWPHGSFWFVLLLIVLVIVFAGMLSIVVCLCSWGIRDVVVRGLCG